MTDGLDALIDRYLAAEAHDRPHLGYPATAAGTELYRSSRQYQSAHETLSEATQSAEMTAMVGAWDSLPPEYEAVLRADAIRRAAPHNGTTQGDHWNHAIILLAAKRALVRLLSDRGIFYPMPLDH